MITYLARFELSTIHDIRMLPPDKQIQAIAIWDDYRIDLACNPLTEVPQIEDRSINSAIKPTLITMYRCSAKNASNLKAKAEAKANETKPKPKAESKQTTTNPDKVEKKPEPVKVEKPVKQKHYRITADDVMKEFNSISQHINFNNVDEFENLVGITDLEYGGRVVSDNFDLGAYMYITNCKDRDKKKLLLALLDACPSSVPLKDFLPIGFTTKVVEDETDGVHYVKGDYGYTLNQAVTHFSKVLSERYPK